MFNKGISYKDIDEVEKCSNFTTSCEDLPDFLAKKGCGKYFTKMGRSR